MQFIFQQTPEDIKDLQDHAFDKSKYYRYIGIATIPVIGIILWSLLGDGPEIAMVLSWVIPLVLMAFFFVIFYRFMIKRAMNNPENKKRLYGRREMTFTDDGFSAITPDADTHYQWSAVTKLEESAKSYFLYTGGNQLVLLPKRVAKTPTEQAELELLLHSKFPTNG